MTIPLTPNQQKAYEKRGTPNLIVFFRESWDEIIVTTPEREHETIEYYFKGGLNGVRREFTSLYSIAIDHGAITYVMESEIIHQKDLYDGEQEQ